MIEYKTYLLMQWHRDNRTFDPKNPIIVSDTEIYCSAECYVIAVLSEEEHNGY
jgi:hypothetical protein